MNRPSKLAAELAGTLVVASLLGTSAFAESRHREWTQRDQGSAHTQTQPQAQAQRQSGSDQHQWRGRVQRDTQGGQTYQQPQTTQRVQRERAGGWNRGTVQQPQQTPQLVQPQQRQQYDNRGYNRGNRDNGSSANRGYSQDRANRDNRGYNHDRANRGNDGRGYDRNRGFDNRDNRGYDRNRGYSNRGYDSRGARGYGHYSYPSRGGRSGVVMQGRVSRMYHDHGGYRVWLDNGYSWWVPEARFRLWPLRVGLSIRLGGWWNPLGYYDAYDFGPYDGPFYTSGDLHGVVENVDYYRGTVVIRDDISGSFVTAAIRGGDPRLRDLRPGDYVDISGAWTRSGYFDAYQLQDQRPGGYGGDGYGY